MALKRRKIQFRRDTASNFTLSNIVLKNTEPARETETGLEKMGDRVTP